MLADGPMTGGGYGNENVKKAMGLDWPNNNSAVLYISLPSLQDYDVNLPYFHVFWRKWTPAIFFFFSYSWILSLRI